MRLFSYNAPATTELYTLSLHDALPICVRAGTRLRSRVLHRRSAYAVPAVERDAEVVQLVPPAGDPVLHARGEPDEDRKSTRLNSSHTVISYAVFCLKKKKITEIKVIR